MAMIRKSDNDRQLVSLSHAIEVTDLYIEYTCDN